ncbi:glucose-1-phosphate cytidylyltransferase [Pectinatus haikarae]|uniref:glucose-1-phosphate cytidylyltransferase n=1 Tax=Pectinatus haikarae TaxID=349096 RepID=UPI0018C5B94B|nr:glucose-1-phosphate cytidylyltransferase [Pectinatus haikarae]
MKVVILAGGFGTRISEESQFNPKPMIEIGGKPILWHIMKEYSFFGFNEFIICAGYKQHIIKEYFANYYLHNSNITFDFRNGREITVHDSFLEPWIVTVVDTGFETMTGGRIKRIEPYIENNTFMLTYGDGVCNVAIDKLYEFHKRHKKICTMTAVKPEGRFGILDISNNNEINSFREKRQDDVGYINGGYMVLEPGIFKYIKNDTTVFEQEPLEEIAQNGELMAYKHNGFWQCMDTLRDKNKLEEMWDVGNAPWKLW